LPIIVDLQVDQQGAGIQCSSKNNMSIKVNNPVNKKLIIHLKTKKEGLHNFSMSTIYGQNIFNFSKKLSPNKEKITKDISNLPNGVYILMLSENGQMMGSRKIIKQ
jgi:NAD/NADP transhydrogenase alpha subunit